MEPLLSNRIYNLPEPQWSGEAPFVTAETFSLQHEDLHPVYDLGESLRYGRAFLNLAENFDEFEITQNAWDDIEEALMVVDAIFEADPQDLSEELLAWRESISHYRARRDVLGHDVTIAASHSRINDDMAWTCAMNGVNDIKAQTSIQKVQKSWRYWRAKLIDLPMEGDLQPQFNAIDNAAKAKVFKIQRKEALNAEKKLAFEKRKANEKVFVRKGNVVLNVTRSIFEAKLEPAGFVVV